MYNASSNKMQSLVLNNIERKITVHEININGADHTNHSFLELITKELLQAKTLGEAIIGSRNVADQMKRLDIFREIKVVFDVSPESEDLMNITFNVSEAPRVFAYTGVDFGSYEGCMVSAPKMLI